MNVQDELLANVIELSAQPFGVGYPDGRLGLVNKAFEKLTGYSREELQFIDWAKILTPPEWLEIEQKKLGELHRTGQPIRYEKEYIKKDGTRVPIELLVHLVNDEDGKPKYYYSFIIDITERKRAEEILNERVKELTCLYEINSDAQKNLTIDGFCGRVVEHLVRAMQFPEITAASIELDGRRFTSARYTGELSHDGLQAEIRGREEVCGKLSVYHTEERPYLLPEEENLIKSIAQAVGVWFDNKRMEEALRESEERYRTLVENANEAIVVAQDGKLKFVNRITSKKTGYSEQELTSRPFSELIHPEDRDMVVQSHQRRFKRDVSQSRYSFRVVTKDGSVRWMEIDAVLIEWGGKPATLNFLTDITERKRAEDALKKEKDFSDGLIKTAQAIILVLDTQGRIVMINPYMEEISGYRLDEVRGKDWFGTFLPERDRQRIRELFRRAISGTMTKGNINPIVAKDGRKITIEWRDKILIDPSGKVTGLLSVGQDVTESIRAREEVRALRTQIEFILGATKTGLDIIDADFNIHYIDPEWQKVYGDPTGRKCYDYFMGRDNPCPGCGVVKALQTKSIVVTEEVLAKENSRPIQVTTIPFQNEAGDWLVAEVNVDIAERKRMENELHRSRDELEMRVKERTEELASKNAEMERFIYTVSHDLRSPLISMSGFLGFIEQDAKEGDLERVKADLQIVCDSVSKMDRLLQSTLELSRIGRVISPPEDVPFRDIAGEALGRTEEKLKSRGVKVSIASGMPVVNVDRMRIVEVLVNLIENSIKYMGTQANPDIEIGQRIYGKDRVFFIRDNGIGIDPSQHDKAFELFYMVDKKSEGTGAGLAIVKRIIEVHGGRIWIESELGRGCTVCFTLPLADCQ